MYHTGSPWRDLPTEFGSWKGAYARLRRWSIGGIRQRRCTAVRPTLTVIAEVLGAPRAMREQFLRWGADGVPLVDFGIGYREFRRGELAVDC